VNQTSSPLLKSKCRSGWKTECAWLLDPFEKMSYIYRQNRELEIISGMGTLKGEDVLLDFELNLSGIYGEI